jgi:hypothetical protein
VKMCLCQVSRLSRWRPRYLTSSDWGSWTSLILTGGQVARCVVKVTCVDLVSLTFILHRLSQCWMSSRSIWRRCVATAGSLSVVSTEVSSAKESRNDRKGGSGVSMELTLFYVDNQWKYIGEFGFGIVAEFAWVLQSFYYNLQISHCSHNLGSYAGEFHLWPCTFVITD